jgi:hypothetical protein
VPEPSQVQATVGRKKGVTNEALTVEYQELGQNMRVYVVQRYTQLTPFVALMTGLGALEYATALHVTPVGRVFVALTGILVSVIFLILDRRSHWYWTRLYERSKAVEDLLDLGQFTGIKAKRGLFTATNVTLVFYVLLTGLWMLTLALALIGLANWTPGQTGEIIIGILLGAVSLGLGVFAVTAPGLSSKDYKEAKSK